MIERKWEHEGMTCCIRHGVFGAPCGYVRVPEGHPLFGAGIDKAEASGIAAYGGITFAGELRDPNVDGWWLGFDMGHAFDMRYDRRTREFVPKRTDRECIGETETLAVQLATMEGGL